MILNEYVLCMYSVNIKNEKWLSYFIVMAIKHGSTRKRCIVKQNFNSYFKQI